MPRKPAVRASSAAAQAATGGQVELGTLTIAIDTTTTSSTGAEPVPRAQRERKARTVYSPSTPTKRPVKKVTTAEQNGQQKNKPGRPAKASKAAVKQQQQHKDTLSSEDTDSTAQESGTTPEYKKLEGRIKGQTITFECSQVKRLRYQLAFVEAYETEGWRRASREKLKPSKELETANQKILKDKRAVVTTLAELQHANASDTQYPQLAGGGGSELLLPEDIYCSRCGNTDADEDNDILICDSEGCTRAYHQKCQSPWFKTEDIPVGDELWYCEVCLAIFNSLKLINSAFGTTYDTVAEVFPELEGEEKRAQQGGEDDLGGDEDEDEEDDEDFIADDGDEDEETADTSDESEEEDSEAKPTEEEEAEVKSDVSDQELKYLRKADVIDLNSRSMRSNSKKKNAKSCTQEETEVVNPSFLGQRAAKIDPKTGKIVFGVIVEEQGGQGDSSAVIESQWQVVYYNDTMEILTHAQVLAATALAKEHATELAKQDAHDDDDAVINNPKLIVHGKRKRTQVDYRELNDAMFAGKADSDEEADGDVAAVGSDSALLDEDDEDYVPELKTKKKSSGKAGEESEVADDDTATTTTGKRSRRERKSVDYHALNEGLVGY